MRMINDHFEADLSMRDIVATARGSGSGGAAAGSPSASSPHPLQAVASIRRCS